MMVQLRHIAATLVFLSFLSANAQDPQFSQFYAVPIYLNPAFTGNTQQARITANYRNQWPGIPNSNSFVSSTFTFDYNMEKINSGIGVMVQRDQAGTASLRSTSAHFSYTYRVRLNRKWHWKPALQFGFGQRTVDFNDLIFGDQLVTGNSTSASSNLYRGQGISYMDVSSGILLYSRDTWWGVAAHHLNAPNMSLVQNKSPLPMKLSAHGGFKIPVKRNIKKKVISSFLVAGNYKHQQDWDQLDIGTYFSYDPFIFGLWYRGVPLKPAPGSHLNNESIVAMIGYGYYNFRVGYSYDITISSLSSPITAGAHEIAIVWEWHDPQRDAKRRRASQMYIPCPAF